MKVATWNVNSLRVRLPHVLAWLDQVKPDVLALQETKLPDTDFPVDCFREAGYTASFSGQRTYNGVALLSNKPINEVVTDIPGFQDPQRRVISATIEQVRVINLYVPNGESVSSLKYAYKLNWLQSLNQWLTKQLKQYPQLIVLGDFNIAPQPMDVYDPAAWEDQVLFSIPERDAFQRMLALGLHDCFREKNHKNQEYTWWDYRMNAFKRNLGLRIDHVLASTTLFSHCLKVQIDRLPRTWERPSDHAPVIATFAL